MTRKNKNRRRCAPPQASRKPLARFALPLALCIVAATGVLLAVVIKNQKAAGTRGSLPDVAPYAQKVQSLDDLMKIPSEQLSAVDIAEMNLHCAAGLPGAEKLDIGRCLARMDEWAERVKNITERHLYRANDPRWAEHYKHSEAWLRAEFLAQVLQEDCGVHYNAERVRNIDFKNSKDLFIHGMIDDPNGGTCVSMPVMYVAVGRRLGYPLKLVLTKGHVFARWDDGKERFNIETTGTGGTDSYPDEYYKTWPEKWTEAEKKADYYLKPLSPADELALFLASRGHCLLDTGRTKEAFEAYAVAHRLAPKDLAYFSWMRIAQSRLPGYRDLEAEAEYVVTKQQEAARREWLSSQGARTPGVPPLYAPQSPQRYVPQPAYPYGPHSPSPYAPQPPPYGPRPGAAGQPAMPGQP